MDLDDYQVSARRTAIYREVTGEGSQLAIAYTALGLAGEVGEVADKVKKIIRDSKELNDIEVLNDLEKELGDVLWYFALCCDELGLNPNEVAHKNLDKLAKRQEENKLRGSGDNR